MMKRRAVVYPCLNGSGAEAVVAKRGDEIDDGDDANECMYPLHVATT